MRIAAIQQSKAYQEMADGRPWDKLTENMRKTILYHHILEQTSATLGDTFQDNTQLRTIQFTASLQDLRLALGQAFLPIVHTVLPILTSFARAIERALQVATQFMYSLFGYKGGTKEATKNAQAYDSQAESVSGLGDATEEAGEKIKKAGKEAKRGIADFDEIHELPEPTKAGAGAGGKAGAGGGLGDAMLGGDATLPLYSGMVEWMDQIGGKADELGKKFRNWFKESEGMKTLINGLEDIWTGIVKIYDSKAFKWVIQQFAEDLPDFFDNLGQIAGGVFSTIGGALEEIGYILNGEWENAWKGTEKIWWGLQDVFNGTIGLILPDWGKKLDEATKKSKEKWGEIATYFQTTEKPIRTALEGVKQKITIDLIGALITFSQKTKTTFDNLPTTMSDVWKRTVNGFYNTFSPLYTWIKENVIDRIVRGFNNTFMPIIESIRKKISSVIGSFKSMDTSLGKTMLSAFKSVFNNGATYINKVIDFINKMVKKLNDLPAISGIPTINTKIPYLAKGGIVSSPTMAMIGEAGTEAVTPIDKLQGMITTAVVSAMQFNQGNSSGGDIVLNIDGRSFARIVRPHLEQENKRIGTNVRLNPI